MIKGSNEEWARAGSRLPPFPPLSPLPLSCLPPSIYSSPSAVCIKTPCCPPPSPSFFPAPGTALLSPTPGTACAAAAGWGCHRTASRRGGSTAPGSTHSRAQGRARARRWQGSWCPHQPEGRVIILIDHTKEEIRAERKSEAGRQVGPVTTWKAAHDSCPSTHACTGTGIHTIMHTPSTLATPCAHAWGAWLHAWGATQPASTWAAAPEPERRPLPHLGVVREPQGTANIGPVRLQLGDGVLEGRGGGG